MQASGRHVFRGPLLLSWVWCPHHPPSTRKQNSTPGQGRQPTADLPTPVLGVTGGWLPTRGFPCLSACRESSPTSKGKTHHLLKRGFSCAGRKGGPPTPSLLATLGQRHGARQVCASFRPCGHSLTCPPDRRSSGLCAGAGGRASRGPGGPRALAPPPSARPSVAEPSRPPRFLLSSRGATQRRLIWKADLARSHSQLPRGQRLPGVSTALWATLARAL